MDVANDVKRTAIGSAVRPEPLSLNLHRLNFFLATQVMDEPKTLPIQRVNGTSQLLDVLTNNVVRKVAIRTLLIAEMANFLGNVEHNGDGQDMILSCQSNKRFAIVGLHVCGIHNH